MLFGTWLRAARARGREAGVDYTELACYPDKLTLYMRDQMSLALQTMEELYCRLPSTTEDEPSQRETWENLRGDFVAHMRESLDLLGAVLTAVGCTEEELEAVGSPDDGEEVATGPSEGCTDEEIISSEEAIGDPAPADEAGTGKK